MLSLSVSCIHLELSAAKSPKEQALVLSMILFQRGRKMTELCATRMELDYAFVEFPQLLRAGYRIEGPGRYNTMTLKPDEFIRRFLMHVLPNGFHRIRHCGLLASGTKTETIARARQLIATVAPVQPRSRSLPIVPRQPTRRPTRARIAAVA